MGKSVSRRTLLCGIGPAVLLRAELRDPAPERVEQWDIWEWTFSGPTVGNPFTEVRLQAEFRFGNRSIMVDGFYDGDGIYRIRFMPDMPGSWTFVTRSSAASLHGHNGFFVCVPARNGNRGPVRVRGVQHLTYADGTAHISIGTTCYAWAHQPDDLEEQTLRTLASSPFNKIRMCVLPTEENPHRVPFDKNKILNAVFFQNLDKCIGRLRDLDVQADLILFHPYDHQHFQDMTPAQSELYLRYIVARYAAYRNVWWSMANEYDLVKNRTAAEWDQLFRVLQESDPSGHLRSIHYSRHFYDYSKPWITHLSLQSDDFTSTGNWLADFKKPILFDECKYEGNISKRWGNLSGHEMVRRFWLGMASGAYVGHGETYSGPNGIAWLSKGGTLLGESPSRLAFLKKIWTEAPPHLQVTPDPYYPFVFKPKTYYLYFFDLHQPIEYEFHLDGEASYRADIINIWDMTITPIQSVYKGQFTLTLPGRPFQAVRFQRASI